MVIEMKKRSAISFIFLSLFILLCTIILLLEPEKKRLVVYISGAHNTFFENEDSRNAYSTPCSVGFIYSRGKIGAQNGNIFSSAIEQYAEEKKIEIEIHYLSEKPSKESTQSLLEYAYENDCMPHLVIASRAEQIDYMNLSEQNIMFDWSNYIRQEISQDTYYMDVMEGGVLDGKQVIVPLLFNLNGMITEQDYLNEIEFQMKDYLSYQDFIDLLQKSCIATQNNAVISGITETSGQMLSGNYIPSILLSAFYASYYDETDGSIKITQDVLEEINETTLLYQRQDNAAITNWEQNDFEMNCQNPLLKSRALYLLEDQEAIDRSGIFLSGGRCGGQQVSNSLLTDMMYFNTMYGKDMIVKGIPSVNSPNRYNANVSFFAFSPASLEYETEVFELIHYLMDYEFDMCYGFSINKEVTQNQLYLVQNDVLNVYPNIWGALEAGHIDSIMLDEHKKRYMTWVQKTLL